MQKQAKDEVSMKVKHIEMMLREDYTKYPDLTETIQASLEKQRSGEAEETIEVILQKTRHGVPEGTNEARMLDEHEHQFGVSYRNSGAYEGDVPVVEKERLSGKKNPVMEKEKYEKANK